MVAPAWGEIWWGEKPNAKPRPYLILTRDAAIPVLSRVLVAPVGRKVRGIPTEIPLGVAEGLLTDCAAGMDAVGPIRTAFLVRRMGAVAPSRRREVCEALAAAVDC